MFKSTIPVARAEAWRTTTPGPAIDLRPGKTRPEKSSAGLRAFWRYMTTVRPRNRWLALWCSGLPCLPGCPPPVAGLSYLELDADLAVRGTPEIFECPDCGKRFVIMDVMSH